MAAGMSPLRTHSYQFKNHWSTRGPPAPSQPAPATYSWFYVAFLLAGARSLHASAAAAWQNVPTTGTTRHTWARTLQNTEPIPWQQLHHIITWLQRVAAASGQRLPQHEAALPDRLHTAGRQQPTGTLVHFPCTVSFFQQADGYIPATAQETLLEAYLGERQASAVWPLWRNDGQPTCTLYPATH